jgi:hypothetical protein
MACHVWRGGPMPAAGHGQLGQAAHGWRWAQATAHQVLSHSDRKKASHSKGRRSGRRTTRVLPRILLWSPSTTTGTRSKWGAARPGRPLSRAGTPARDPRGLCLPEPGAARRTGPRGHAEARRCRRRRPTHRAETQPHIPAGPTVDRPPHRIALARRGLSAPPSPCRAALLRR